MDRLELGMGEADLDQGRVAAVFVQEALEVAKAFVISGTGGGTKVAADARPVGPDPVLGPAEFARGRVRTAPALQELAMDFAIRSNERGSVCRRSRPKFIAWT